METFDTDKSKENWIFVSLTPDGSKKESLTFAFSNFGNSEGPLRTETFLLFLFLNYCDKIIASIDDSNKIKIISRARYLIIQVFTKFMEY